MQPVFDVFAQSFNGIVRATNNLPTYIKSLGVIGFLFLGTKGKLLTLAIGYVVDYALQAYASLGKALAKAKEIAATAADAIGLDGTAERLRSEAAEIKGEMNKITEGLKETGDAANDAEIEQLSYLEKIESGEIVLGSYGQKMYELVLTLRSKIKELELTRKKVEDLDKAMGDGEKTTKRSQITMENFKETFEKTFDKAYDKFLPMQEGVDLLLSSFETFKRSVGDAFADAILGAKSFAESIRDVAQAILRQLISGLIQIGLEVFVFDVLREKMKKVRDEQSKLNNALGIELGLRTALAFFTGGGSLFAGFFADGGKIPAGKFGMVGEEGPELISGPATVTPMSTAQYQTQAEGDVNINFNISTVDARGFDELLMSRRGMIQGIINQGLTRQGRRALA
jgi:hypothetical protein